MTDEIKIWAINASSREVALVEPTDKTDTEKLLEDTLVEHPEMLISGLTIVGRQTPTAGGPLDLLGIDSEGQLVVFELKRGTLTRDAITQVIDYASDLESMSDVDLATHIAEKSGKNGVDKIDDFEEWYSQRFAEQQLTSLTGCGKTLRSTQDSKRLDDKRHHICAACNNSSKRATI